MQTKEEKKATAKARVERYIAERRCVRCGKQDARTLSGRRYCKKCSDKRAAKEKEKKETEGAHRVPKKDTIVYALGRCPYMHGGELSCLDCLRPTCREDEDQRKHNGGARRKAAEKPRGEQKAAGEAAGCGPVCALRSPPGTGGTADLHKVRDETADCTPGGV